MKRLLLGLILLAIIFVAVLCKPIDNCHQNELLEVKQTGTIANQNIK